VTRTALRLTAGWALLVAGALLLLLPGPGIPLVLLALTLLGRHHRWAFETRAWISARLPRRRRPER